MKKMKDYIIPFIAIVVAVAVITIIGINMNKNAQEEKRKRLANESWISNNTEITTTAINPIVNTVVKDPDITTYNMLYQKVVTEKIDELLKNEYTIDMPLFVYNPYNTNANSINMYFTTEEDTRVSYTISADGVKDFSKTLKNDGDDNYTTVHKYQLLGFVMEKKNTLVVKLTKKDGSSHEYEFEFNFTNYYNEGQQKLDVTKKTKDELSDGLYTVLGNDSEDKDFIYLYDNDGVLRGEIPIIGYRGHRILFDDDKMYASISETKIAEFNSLGQVTKKYDLGKYKLHHDYVFDDDKNILILATDTTKESCEDMVIRLNLETGKVDAVMDLTKVFPDMRRDAYYDENVPNNGDSTGVDWMHINTINYIEDETVILSSRETSSIIKLINIFSDPEVDYIIGPDKFWKDTIGEEYLLDKEGNFTIQGGQHTVTYEATDDSDEYYLSMFNNNIGVSSTVPDFDWSSIGLKNDSANEGDTSYYYRYFVDEEDESFELVEKFKVPYSGYVSSIQEKDDNKIVDSGMKCQFSEYNKNNKVIRTYKMDCEKFIYRVYKYDYTNLFY